MYGCASKAGLSIASSRIRSVRAPDLLAGASRALAPRCGAAAGQRITRANYSCSQRCLRKVFRVQRNYEVGISVLGTIANVVVVGIGREIAPRSDFDLFAFRTQRVNDFSNQRAADTEPGKHLSVLVQYFFGDQPDECLVFRPAHYKARA